MAKYENDVYVIVSFSAGDETITVDMADGEPDDATIEVIDEDFEITSVDSNIADVEEYMNATCTSFDEVKDVADQLGALMADVEMVNNCVTAFGLEDALEWAVDDVMNEDQDMVEDAMEVFGVERGLQLVVNKEVKYMEGITDDEGLGAFTVEQFGFPHDVLPYLDLASLAEDLQQDMDEDECERVEAEYGDMITYAQRYVEDDGLGDNYDPYFDYDAYGHDVYGDYSGGYGSNGFVYTD